MYRLIVKASSVPKDKSLGGWKPAKWQRERTTRTDTEQGILASSKDWTSQSSASCKKRVKSMDPVARLLGLKSSCTV
jgi:hypothetical protein